MLFVSSRGSLLNHIRPQSRQDPGSDGSCVRARRTRANRDRRRGPPACGGWTNRPASFHRCARIARAAFGQIARGNRRRCVRGLWSVLPEPLAPELLELADELGIDLVGFVLGRRFDELDHGLFARDALLSFGKRALASLGRFALRRDIETPPGEPRGEPHVLPIAADCQRELIIGNDDERNAVVLEELDADYLRRCARVGYKQGGRRIVTNDVDLLAAEIIGDVCDATRLGAQARADRIDLGTIALHRNLRSASGIPRDRHDLNGAVGDLRNFHLEQSLHQTFGRAREDYLRSLRRLLDVEHVGANEIVDAIGLARNLLVEIHDGFVAPLERHVHVALLVALYRPRNEVVELAYVLIVDRVPLGFPNALHDDLLGGLRGDSPEVFRRHLLIEVIPDLIRPAG